MLFPEAAPALDWATGLSPGVKGAVFIFLFLIQGFFLALKLAGVRGPNKNFHTEHERGH